MESKLRWRFARLSRQGLSVILSMLMILIPMGQSSAFAQDNDSQGRLADVINPAGAEPLEKDSQPLTADQIDQLVAPIALYPDSLVAQVLAASTYPTQVVEANRWLKAQGDASAEEIAAAVDSQNWDPSVKALTAFPSVLDQLDRNLQWTTDLGNAYYNQPEDVMASIQSMRQRAQEAGNLESNQQQTVTEENGNVVIVPANPEVVYVPVYDPWLVWGGPFVAYPGYYYYVPPGIYFGGLLIGWGIGINIGFWGGWGWGWNYWGCHWHSRSIYFHHTRYFTRSRTVFSRGFGRPGGPPHGYRRRGSYYRGRVNLDRYGSGYTRRSSPATRRGMGRGFNRGSGSRIDRGTRRGFNRDTRPGVNRGTRRQFNRGTQPNVNRGTRRGTSRGTDRGIRRRSRPGTSRGTRPNMNRGTQREFNRGTRPGINRGTGGRRYQRQSAPSIRQAPRGTVRRGPTYNRRSFGTSRPGTSVRRGGSYGHSYGRSMSRPSGSSRGGGTFRGGGSRGGGGGHWGGGGRGGGGGHRGGGGGRHR